MIDGFGRALKGVQMSQMYSAMRTARIRPNFVTFTSLVEGFAKSGNIIELETILAEFKKLYQITPDSYLYTTIIEALTKRGFEEKAINLMLTMKKDNVPLTIKCCTALLLGLRKSNLTITLAENLKRLHGTQLVDPDTAEVMVKFLENYKKFSE